MISPRQARPLTVASPAAVWGLWDSLCLCFMVSGLCLLFLGMLLGSMFPALAFMAALAMVLLGLAAMCMGGILIRLLPKRRPQASFSQAAGAGYPAVGHGTPVTFRQFSDRLHNP
jgi:hypothetical protein